MEEVIAAIQNIAATSYTRVALIGYPIDTPFNTVDIEAYKRLFI